MKGGGLRRDIGMLFSNISSPRWRSSEIRIVGKETVKMGVQFSSVQFSHVTQSCPTLCDPMNRSTPGLPIHHQFPEFTQSHVHQVGDAIQPSHPLSSPSPAPVPPSIRLFSNESTSHRWPCENPKYWSFCFSIK